MQFGYVSRLEKDTGRWVEQGLITADAADAILKDAHSRRGGYSFSTVIIILGVICLCFAAMTFVAANWDEMPRLLRVGLLIAAMWASYVGSVLAQNRGRTGIADALVLLGSGIFGAAIMLVGQMYHLQGKAEDAVLLWAAGTFVAAAVLRSRGALWLAIILFAIWFLMRLDPDFESAPDAVDFWYLATWLPCAALAWWLHSRGAAHLLAIGLIGWIVISAVILTDRDNTITWFACLHAVFFLAAAIALLSIKGGNWLRGFESAVIGYSVLSIIGTTGVWTAIQVFNDDDAEIRLAVQLMNFIPYVAILAAIAAIAGWARQMRSTQFYDIAFCLVFAATGALLLTQQAQQIPFDTEFYALALSIWFIRMGWRQDIATVTRLGYFAFALTMLLIYFRTAGTLLGTTGFYLTAGLLLVLGAIFFPRLLRLMPGRPPGSDEEPEAAS